MAKFRTFLAYLIALAVAIAPVTVTLVAGAQTAGASAVHDCHGAAAKHHPAAGCPDGAAMGHHCHDAALAHDESPVTDGGGCPDCDGKRPVKCIGDNGKCCKLTGVVAMLPVMVVAVEARDVAANEPVLSGWQIRPPPPPPRT